MIFCVVDDGILKDFTILHWETLLWNSSIFGRFLFFLLIAEPLPLSGALFIPNHVTDLLSVYLMTCSLFLQLFLFSTTWVLLPLCQLFWEMLLPSTSRWANIFHEKAKCHNVSIQCVFYVLLWEIHCFKSVNPVFLYIRHRHPNSFRVRVVLSVVWLPFLLFETENQPNLFEM